MPLRNVATTFTIEQQRLEINALAGDVNNIATGVTNVGTAATANALAAGATGADLTLSGTLTVNGTQTILNTATLEVEDKNIVIAKGSSTDAAASGGGITLKGADDKTISYSQTGDKWVANKNFEAPNLAYTSGGQTFSGNITIQTASAADLMIGSTGTGESRIYLDASNGDFSGADYAYIKQSDGAGGSGASLRIGNMNDGGIQFLVGEGFGGAGNALEIINDGKIGIGKTPGANLDIAATNSSSIGTHSFRLGAFGIRCEDVDNYNVWAIEKNYGGWGSAVVLQASGRVGIGTGTAGTELDALLTIKGDSNGDSVPSIRLKDGADSRECWISNNSGDLFLVNGGNDNAYHSRIRLMDGRAIYFDIDGAASTGSFGVDANGCYDLKGNLRRVPSNSPNSAHVATAADAGKCIYIAYDVHFNPSVFSSGDVVTIIPTTGITIKQNSGMTIYNTADASTGDRSLAARGMATLWFADHNIAYISGAQLT